MPRLAWVFCGVLLVGTAHAAPSLPRPAAGVPLPPEWQGVWASVDSVYACDGSLINVVARLDTLCAGAEVPRDPNVPPYIQGTCGSGSADATHIQEHCSQGAGLCGEACFITNMVDLDATRSGDSAFWSWLTQEVSSCHATICDFCMLTHRHATRVAPGPCGPVPTESSTWGKVRASYR